MKRNIKNILKYVLSALLAVGLLYLAFRGVDWKSFIEALGQTRWAFVLLSMFCGLLAFAFRAFRWRMLLLPLNSKVSRMSAFDGVNIGNMANCALPFAGEFVRCGVIRTASLPFDRVLGTIALERAWDFISIVLIIAAVVICKAEAFSAFFKESILGPLAQRFSSGAWIILVLVLIALLAAIGFVIAKKDKNPLCAKIASVVEGICQGFVSFLKMDGKLRFLLYTVIIWGMYFLMTVFVIEALPSASSLGVSDALFIMAVGSIASVIPVPGGFGAYHYIVALTLSTLYGFTWEAGILFATVSHESQAINMVLWGVVSWIHYSLTKKKVSE